MRKIYNPKLLESYIEKYNLKDICSIEVLKAMELFSYERGEQICTVGEPLDCMFFLVKGKMKVYTTMENAKSLLLRFYNPLSIVGDMEFLSSYKVRCNVESLKESLVIGIKFETLMQYAYDDPKFLRFLNKNIVHKLYTISNMTSMNLLYPVENRFASYLLSVNVDEQDSLYRGEIKTSKLTEVATLLGTSYRHLNRTVQDFIAKGIIIREKGFISIKDIEKLKQLSYGNLYE
ncbi:cyclic nucleotide-binding domain-containing protein [Geosporobacter ferrireducens]|uniref:Transcriptional regulator n=2 Tax=Geosporobacter ferrireducens TaxID=1424294 RepID=A0A1D8GEQ0_9FIRM|nr:cyclic nucleotide-binding domain-containing protein [Geosporobacter ferrireducens]AOT69350.1 transcriptional regulator [Geosporobacter ferrireducens]MTI57037.1 cyclic nucleotide-binding domain-containing protein [Geosporobacter ferrireducens]